MNQAPLEIVACPRCGSATTTRQNRVTENAFLGRTRFSAFSRTAVRGLFLQLLALAIPGVAIWAFFASGADSW